MLGKRVIPPVFLGRVPNFQMKSTMFKMKMKWFSVLDENDIERTIAERNNPIPR
jgi:hypothetical protein